MNVLLKDKISKVEGEIQRNESQKHVVEERLRLTTEHNEKAKKNNKQQLEEQQKSLEEIQKTLKEIEDRVVNCNKDIEKIDRRMLQTAEPARATRQRLVMAQADLKNQFARIHQELLLYMQNNTCPTCRQEITKDFKQKIVKEREATILQIEEAQIKLDEKLKKADESVKELEQTIKLKHSFENQLLGLTTRAELLESQEKGISCKTNPSFTENSKSRIGKS